MAEVRRVVLVPEADYKALLERMVLAPKNKPGRYNPLSPKQRAKVDKLMEEACVVNMAMHTMGAQPAAVQQRMEQTLH